MNNMKLTLNNTPPTNKTILIDPTETKIKNTLNYNTNKTENPNNDPITWTYNWTINNTIMTKTTEPTLSTPTFTKNNKISYTTTPTNNELNNLPIKNKLTLLIQNTLPNLLSTKMNPNKTNKSNNLTYNYENWTDPNKKNKKNVTYT